jgi:hypothetical protein
VFSTDIVRPEGEPKAIFFDPEQDLAITFRPARINLGCSMYWPFYFVSRYDHTGVSKYWYINSTDMITAAAQAWRDRNTNPQLYLHRRSGSSYYSVDSSASGRYMDVVGHPYGGSSCSSSDYRVKVCMSNEGWYNLLIVAFNAQ